MYWFILFILLGVVSLFRRLRIQTIVSVDRWFRPWLEPLEDRTLLSVLRWGGPGRGSNNHDWNVAANWRDVSPTVTGAPQATNAPKSGDTLIFNNGGNNDSIDNMPGLKLAALTADATYTQTITLTTDLTIAGGSMAGGKIGGRGTLTIGQFVVGATTINAGTFTWSGGEILGRGRLIVTSDPGAKLLIQGNVTLTGRILQVNAPRAVAAGANPPVQVEMTAGTLSLDTLGSIDNAGVIKVSGTAASIKGTGTGPHTIENAPGSLFVLDRPGATFTIEGAAFNNSSPAGSTQVRIDNGTLMLKGGGSLGGIANLGKAGSSGTIAFSVPENGPDHVDYYLAQGFHFTGKGSVLLYSSSSGTKDPIVHVAGTLTFGGDIRFAGYGGTLTGSGKVILLDGMTTLRGTVVTGPITVVVNPMAVLNFGRLLVGGRTPWRAPALDNRAKVQVNGGILSLNSNTDLYMSNGSSIALSFAIPFGGLLGAIPSIGQLALATNSNLLLGIGSTSSPSLSVGGGCRIIKLRNSGKSRIAAGITVLFPAGGPNPVQKEEGAGDLDIGGPVKYVSLGGGAPGPEAIVGAFQATTGVLGLPIGTTLLGNTSVAAQAIVNSGTIQPGDAASIGTLTFTGDLQETTTGTIDITIAGASPGVTFDQVQDNGFATLGGTLNINLNGFTPTLGQTFKILSLPNGYTGTFASILDPTFGSGNSLTFQVIYNANDVTLSVVSVNSSAPTVTSLGTTSGTTGGGTSVTINGSNFAGVTAVTFGGLPVASFTVNSSTQITAITPPGTSGSTSVSVTTVSGTGTLGGAYTYIAAAAPSVTSLGTTSGYTDGGTSVTINGSGFLGATAVSFGTQAATYYRVVSDTQILAYSPGSTTTGPVDVTVTTPTGTSPTGSGDQFTYNAIPTPTVT